MRCFVHVAEQNSVTRAAEQLSLAPSAVSRRLKELETRLGVQLVSRTTRRMSLTEEGQQFFRRCQRILADLEEAEAEIADGGKGLRGQLRLAAPLSFGLAHLTPLVCSFAKSNPELTLDIDLSDRLVDLVGEGFDVALRIGTLRDSSLIARKLCEMRMIACAAPAFLDTHGRPERPEELRGMPALCYAGSTRPDIWRYRDEDGNEQAVQLDVRLRATNGDMLRDAAIAGLGVVLKPSFIVARAIRAGALEVILPETDWSGIALQLVYPNTRHVAPKTRAFIEAARGHFGAEPHWERELGLT
nr:LysR family transcriptional regulator [Limibaculum sp. NKW23]